jgi:hypothetical protein
MTDMACFRREVREPVEWVQLVVQFFCNLNAHKKELGFYIAKAIFKKKTYWRKMASGQPQE